MKEGREKKEKFMSAMGYSYSLKKSNVKKLIVINISK